MQPVFDFDAAVALNKGQRTYQEDAVIIDFARGADMGVAVLADGMGGHAAGDVASKIVVTEVFSELLFQRTNAEKFEKHASAILRNAAQAANACLKDHVAAFPDTRGMGATLVASVILNRHLYWISIGDSPLFLFRDGALTQLNEDHSMAPQIDFMVKSGLIGAEEAASHPDRNTLTSVLFGEAIPKIDCPADPLILKDGDVLIVASDGLQFLPDAQITAILQRVGHLQSAAIVDQLLQSVLDLGDPDLDNVSFSVVKMEKAASLSDKAETDATKRTDFRCVG